MNDPANESQPERSLDPTREARRIALAARYGDGSDGSSPTADQWARLLEGPADAPVTVVNVIKLRDEARYPQESAAPEPAGSGGEAMMRYAAVSGPALERVGGRFLLMGPFEASLMGPDEAWDLVAVGTYPSREALFALFEDEAYAEAYRHRRAAVERQRVLVVGG